MDPQICSYYKPSEGDEHSVKQFEESLQKLGQSSNSFVMIRGDINFPGYDWQLKALKPNCKYPTITYKFVDLLDDHALSQQPTRFENTLDLFITNNDFIVKSVQIFPGLSDHEIVQPEIYIKSIINQQKPRKVPLYKKADWDSLKEHMHAFSLNFVNSSEITDDVDMLWSNFSNQLERSIMKYIPHRTTSTKNRPPWISREIKRLFRKREKLDRKSKKSANPMKEEEKIKKLKQTIQSAGRKAYWSYVENLITESKEEPQSNTFEVSKRFWSFIEHKKTDSSAVQSLKVSGNMVTDPKAKANALNAQFQPAFSNQTPMSLKKIYADYLAKNSIGDDNLIMPEFDVSITDEVFLKSGFYFAGSYCRFKFFVFNSFLQSFS